MFPNGTNDNVAINDAGAVEEGMVSPENRRNTQHRCQPRRIVTAILCDISFENTKSFVETIVPAPDKNGHWRIVGVFYLQMQEPTATIPSPSWSFR
jgi:hypothetical protein